jgi:Spy/CpxP family protein refolding chaperone
MKKKWFILGIILITIINLSALGTLMYNHWDNQNTSGLSNDTVSHGCYMKRHLNISDDQVSNLDASENMYRQKVDLISRQIIENRADLVSELLKEKSDTIRIVQILKRIDSLQSLIQMDVVHRLINEKNMLTPEQRSGYFSLVLGKLCYEVDSINSANCQKHINERK